MYLLWAYGDSNSVSYSDGNFNQHKAKGYAKVNFISGCTSLDLGGLSLIHAHAIMMSIAWLVLVPIAMVAGHRCTLIIVDFLSISKKRDLEMVLSSCVDFSSGC